MRKCKMPYLAVLDNGGKTADRYTVRIGEDIFGMSDNPFHPQGFNQYCGTLGECGYNWQTIEANCGRRLMGTEIPEVIWQAIHDRMEAK